MGLLKEVATHLFSFVALFLFGKEYHVCLCHRIVFTWLSEQIENTFTYLFCGWCVLIFVEKRVRPAKIYIIQR